MSFLARPLTVFRRVAVAEAITWALLLLGMVLKYVTHTTDLGVRIFGMLHGVVFITYVVTTTLVWIDQRWTARRGFGALAASIPPFVTYLVERRATRDAWIGASWRLREPSATIRSLPERAAHWVLIAPLRGLVAALIAIAALTGIALLVGPPASS